MGLHSLVFLLLVSTAAQASTTTEQPRLLVMNLQASEGVKKETALTFTDFLTAYLAESKKFTVLSQRDLAQLASLEAEKQAQGCDSDSCLGELAGALGARLVTYGRMGRLGNAWFVQVTLVQAASLASLGLSNCKRALKTQNRRSAWRRPGPPAPSAIDHPIVKRAIAELSPSRRRAVMRATTEAWNRVKTAGVPRMTAADPAAGEKRPTQRSMELEGLQGVV